MNLTQWMCFCKSVDFSSAHPTLTCLKLAKIFQQHERENKRFQVSDFKMAVHHILKLMFGQEEILTTGYKFLGIESEESFHQKMKKFGVKVTEQKITFRKTVHQNKITTEVETKEIHKTQKKKTKYYKTREDRKQSLILSRLNVSNLSQLKINDAMQKKLKNLTKGEDSYLKKYNKRSNEKTQKGVINRLDKRINSIINKMK